MRGLTTTAAVAAIIGSAAAAPAQPADPLLEDPAFEASLPPLDAPPAADPATPLPEPVPADPELSQPLPPIATFDATPPPAITVADEAGTDIRYTTEIVGLKEIDLEARFRSLSALVKDGKKAANAAQVSARAEEDIKLIERLLRSEGYYDGIATSVVDPLPDQPGRVAVTLTATPGSRYALGAVAVTGPETVPPRLAYDALALKTGDPIVAAAEIGRAHV